MNKRISGKTILLMGLSLVFLFACNPQKKIIKEPIKVKGADYLFQQLEKNEFKFNRLNIKFSVNVSINKKDNSFGGNIRIRKDSAIWLSISPMLGIEALRILITNDSVKLLNRIETTFFASDFKLINNLLKTDLDYDMIQSLLVGIDFSTYQNDVFKASVDGGQYLLSTIGRGKLKKLLKNKDDSLRILMQDIWLDPNTYKITRIRIKELKENRKLEAEYSDFEKGDSTFFPKKIDIVVTDEKNKIEIAVENSKVAETQTLEFPFNVSSRYKKIFK
jgi:hypothetical protein